MKKYVIITIVILALVGIYFGFFKKTSNGETKKVYKYGDVEKGKIEIKILSTGSIKPFNQVGIKATSRGRIEEVFVQEGDMVEVGTVLATISSEDRNSILDAAISQIKIAKESKNKNAIKEADIAYQVAQSAYKPVFLTSTIKGEIINRSCETGQNVDLSNELFVLSDKLVGRVDIDEVDIAKMKKGLKAYITLDAYPDKANTGKISKISREGQTISDVVVYEILVEPDAVPEEWASGMTANIEFVTKSKDNIIICPMSAIREEKGETYVLIKNNSKERPSRGSNVKNGLMEEPEKRLVKKGIDDGRFVEIIEGLDIGEKVVTEITEISNEKKNNSLFGPGRRRN